MLSVLLSTLLLTPLAAAQTVQDLWTFPKAPDFTTNITVGTTVEVRWKPLLNETFGLYCTECDITDVDLWATGKDISRLLEAGINIQTTQSYQWKVTFDASDVKSSPAFALRFLPAGAKWDGTGGQEVSSPQFNILAAASSSSSSSTTPSASTMETPSTSSSSSSTVSTSSTAATESAGTTATDETTTSASSATPDATPTDPSDNSAAGAHLSARVALGAIALVGSFILL
ncbi:hypothetical protein BJY01DRAFT_253955 [Aspergillus pseudoustus]|uniref:Ser-Thr-rich glycosyl-phosphatidyl-inositol-anchored membrane family-domain-containing protein n=1 Tax=Aspergillus pseudoustus TaxID=1810923 RepID=A0ABR4IWX3_9EURO